MKIEPDFETEVYVAEADANFPLTIGDVTDADGNLQVLNKWVYTIICSINYTV